MGLEEGEILLDRVLEREGFERAPGQMFTEKDGNCGVSALLHLLQIQQPSEGYDDLDTLMFRKMIVHFFKTQVKEGVLIAATNLNLWGGIMSRPGIFVDHYWLQACSNYTGTEIIMIPTFSESSTEIGRIIRIIPCKNRGHKPLFLGYMEDNLGHFQAIQPMGANNSILMYLQNNVRIDPPEPSPSFPSILMSRHVPLSNMPESQISIINGTANRNRFFSETEISGAVVLNSTKRAREDEDTMSQSKKSKLDISSACHVCHFKLRKNNKKKRCFCRRLVHHSCFLADGSNCR